MTTFPGSPKSLKGAIIAIDLATNQIVSTIAFQYNPDTISRTLQPKISNRIDGEKTEVFYIKGAPLETIQLDVELDATDQLEKGNKTEIELGIYPLLSALEILVYPQSSQVAFNMLLAKAGTIAIEYPEAPLTLLVWGSKRVVPVKLESFTINEEAYDVNLNPIRAKVTLSLRVLNYSDLPWDRGAMLYLAHHKTKELMAIKGTISSLGTLTTATINRFF